MANGSGSPVVVGDDASSDGTYERLLAAGCWVVRNPQRLHLAGNVLTLRRAFAEAQRLFDVPIVLKVDPDSLAIGPGLPAALRAAFAGDATIGLAGTYHVDWNGNARDLSHWARVIFHRRQDFEPVLASALANGYQEAGDGVQGEAVRYRGPVSTKSCATAGCAGMAATGPR